MDDIDLEILYEEELFEANIARCEKDFENELFSHEI